MISSLVLEGGRRLVKNPGPARLRKLVRSGKNIVWIDVQDPTDKDYDFLRADFDLHPLTVDDCRQDLEMPKTEEFSKYLFVGFHKVQYDRETREIELAEVDSILGKNYLVTVHKGERPSVISLRKRIEDNPKSMLRGADFLLHSLMDYIIDEYLLKGKITTTGNKKRTSVKDTFNPEIITTGRIDRSTHISGPDGGNRKQVLVMIFP